MRTSTIFGVIVVILIVAGVAWAITKQPAPIVGEQQNTTPSANTASSTDQGTTPAGGDDVGMPDTGTVSGSVGATVGSTNAPMSATVTLTASGFSPKTVTIAKGGTVTFVNQSGRGMWVGADEHPTHTEYDSTSRAAHCAAGYTGAKPFDQCASGQSYSFTFTKTGSFDYHDHLAAQFEGRVVVK